MTLAAVGATLLPFLGVLPGSIITKRNRPWYKKIKRPSFMPPSWVLGPIWTCLYVGMGFASYLVWRDGGDTTCLALYSLQLLLNWAWPPIFFGLHDARAAMLEICLLWVSVLACGLKFYAVNPVAGLLFLPYQLWVSLASALTFNIWRMNGDRP